MDRIEVERQVVGDLKAELLDTRKQLCIGVAEEVNGLHGVADDKAGAALALRPCGDEMREQLVLAAARVLKFVDEQMANAVGDGLRGVGGKPVVASEYVERDLRDLDEVGGRGFREDDLQFAGGMAQQREAGAHDVPFFFAVAR